VRERRAITPDTALRLSRYFGTSPEFWMDLQSAFDLKIAAKDAGAKIEAEIPRGQHRHAQHEGEPRRRPQGLHLQSRQSM